MSKAKQWGEVYLPDQREPFIKDTIVALENLVIRVQELNLAPLHLEARYYDQGIRVVVDGHKITQSLWITERGVSARARWGILRKNQAFRVIDKKELPELLESHQLGLGDIESIMQKIDVIVLLRQLVQMPAAKQLLRPLKINQDSWGGYTFLLQLTKDGLNYYKYCGGVTNKIYLADEIDLNAINEWSSGQLTPEIVTSAIAKLKG